MPVDVSDKLNGRQSVVNVTENLNFARIYWEVILSTYNKVRSFLSTIIESLGSLRVKLPIKFKFRFLRSSTFQPDINRTTLIVCENYSDTWMRKLLPWPNTIYSVFQHGHPGY